jgi:hypothetical protein
MSAIASINEFNLSEGTINLILIQFLQELRRLKIENLKEKQRELTKTVLDKIIEGSVPDPLDPLKKYKILEFINKPRLETNWIAKFKCPLLPEWFEDLDYTKLVTRARTNIAGMRNIDTSFHFQSENWKLYTKNILHDIVKTWHKQLYADYERAKGKEATDELWLIQAVSHTTTCPINASTIIFKPGFDYEQEVKRYKIDIDDEKVHMARHLKELQNVNKKIEKEKKAKKKKTVSEKLIRKKNEAQDKINASWELIAGKKNEIKHIEKLMEKGTDQAPRDKIKFIPGRYDKHVEIVRDVQKRVFPNQSDAFYGLFLPSFIVYDWNQLVWLSGYLPGVPIPYMANPMGHPTGLMEYHNRPLPTTMKVGENLTTFYTAELTLPFTIDDKYFRPHEVEIKSQQDHEKELIAAEAEYVKTKEDAKKTTVKLKKKVLSDASKKVSCDKEEDIKLPSKPLREVSEFENYLNECDKNNSSEHNTIVWSEIVKILNGMEAAHKDTMNGRYGGGFATYLYTKGKYDTTDIDYKIYPTMTESEEERNLKMKIIKEHVETYINNNKKNLLDSINGDKNDFKEILTKWSIGRVTAEQEAAAQKNRDGVFKITLVSSNPGFGSDGTFYANPKVVYCDIGFWSEDDVTAEVAIKYGFKDIVDGIAPGVDANFYNKFQMRVINKDFIIAEKKMFLDDEKNNSSIQHKIPSWNQQIKLLEGLGGKKGGRKKRTRKRRKKKYKKRRTKKKRRKRRKKTRRRK